MMKICFVLVFFIGSITGIFGQLRPENAVVLKEPLKVFAAPGENSDVVTTLEPGKKISVQKSESEWLRITFFADLEVWTASCFIKDGEYTDQVIFRVKSTSASSAVSVKETFAGKKTQIIGTGKWGFWKKVKISGAFYGYIPRKNLYPETKPAVVRKTGSAEWRTEVPPAFVGKLLPLKKKMFQATHKLIYTVNGVNYLVAYIVPDKANLSLWQDWNVHISGEVFWNKSVYTPFMKGTNIHPVLQ